MAVGGLQFDQPAVDALDLGGAVVDQRRVVLDLRPAPTRGKSPAVSANMRASTAVDGAISGAPDRPPVSLAWALFKDCGRAMVVFETIRPSSAPARAIAAMSARSSSSRSGAIFNSSGGRLAPTLAWSRAARVRPTSPSNWSRP